MNLLTRTRLAHADPADIGFDTDQNCDELPDENPSEVAGGKKRRSENDHQPRSPSGVETWDGNLSDKDGNPNSLTRLAWSSGGPPNLYRSESGVLPSMSVTPNCAPSSA